EASHLTHNGIDVLQLETVPMHAATFFKLLYLPQLAKLSVNVPKHLTTTKKDAASMLNALILNSAPPLRELYLQRVNAVDSDIFKALNAAPLLERLVLLDAIVSEKMVTALSIPRRRGTGWVCPKLTHLCISSKPLIPRPVMVSVAAARRKEALDCAAKGVAPTVVALICVRLDNAELVDPHLVEQGDGTSAPTWLEHDGEFEYTFLPERRANETAWSEIEDLL
ncbi:hypothetical protein EXIGLDRAFT_736506, partial [Exidia glandulosa HHB12029]